MFLRGSIWYTKIKINGNKRRVSLKTSDKKLARQVERQLKAQIITGTWQGNQKDSDLTFKEFAKKWEEIRESDMKPSTLSRDKSIIRRLFEPEFGNKKLTQITTTELVAFAANRKKLATSPKTAINQIALLKLMFAQARQWGYLDINPAVDLKRPKDSKKEIEILAPTELYLLIESSHDHYRMAFKTAIMTGVRAGELWALKWIDFQPATKQLFIRRSVWKGQFQTPKTKHAIRAIDLTDELVYELKVWKLACPPNANDLVFPSPEGEISQHDNVMHRYFLPALRKAKLRQVSFHSLRHSNASLRIKAGQNPKYLSRQMGHASVAFTLDVYGHLFDDDPQFYRNQARLLDDALKVKEYSEGVQEGSNWGSTQEKRDSSETPKSLILFGSGG